MIPIARPILGSRERTAVDRVLRSGSLVQGVEVAAFEDEFSKVVVGGRRCVAVNSGTSALHLSLLAAGIGAGDEVIVPSFTFAASANSIALTGATPIFADVEPAHFCVDPEAVKALITPKTAAVMAVHLYGHPAAVDKLREVCDRHHLLLIEDAAQAHASALHGRPVATWGTIGCFSFYPTKNMTSGEGGMVVTDSQEIADKVRLLRNQGQERPYENQIVGLNNRMTEVHAAIGRVQLTQLNDWTKIRQVNAAQLSHNLEGVVVPAVSPGAVHVYNQYTIRIMNQDRDRFRSELAARGVGSGVYYPVANHQLPPFRQEADLPETNRVVRECLSLPVHPSLSEREVVKIIDAVNLVAETST